MSSVKYEFRYMPLIGKLSGESMLQQTEQAINEIAEIVNENTAQADIINTLAQDANDNSVEALEKANEALETSSRVYIHESLAVNLDSYCESQLIYVANISSTNLPIAKKGFLEVKTDDDKTECVQLFVSDDKDVYVRSGSITAETVGDVTVYTADFEEWTSLSSPTILLQAGNGTSIPLSADLNDYNTEGTFYCSTTNVGSIAHCPVSEGEFKLIVMKFATANYGLQMLYPSGQHLYVRKYSGGAWGNWEVIVPKITSGVTNGSIAVNDTDVPVTGWNTKADLDSPVFVGTPTAPTPESSDNSTKLATTGFVNTKAGNYLPLSGGTLTGAIEINQTGNNPIKTRVRSAYNDIQFLDENGANRVGIIRVTHDTTNKYNSILLGTHQYGTNNAPNGISVTYNETSVTTSAPTPDNGDNSGKIATTAFVHNNYLPLSGGTMTGAIKRSGWSIVVETADTTSVLEFDAYNKSTSQTVGGAIINLFGKDHAGAGRFDLIASNGTNTKDLRGTPSGSLTWDGKTVIVGTEATETFTIDSITGGAYETKSIAQKPRYYSVSLSGTGFADMCVNKNDNRTFYVKNNGSITRTNITITIDYIY